MTAMREVAVFLPPRVPVAELQEDLGLTDDELRTFVRSHGYGTVCHDPATSDAELLLGAARNLGSLASLAPAVRYVVRSRSMRWSAPYPEVPAATVARAMGLEHAESFTLQDRACAGALHALDLAGTLLAADPDPDALALLLVGEKTYGRVNRVIPGMSLQGEATAAVLVSAQGPSDVLLSYRSEPVPVGGSSMAMDDAARAHFSAVHWETFDSVVAQALDGAELTGQDIALYLPMNTSRLISAMGASRTGIPRSRIVSELARTGHCWGADTFLNLRAALDDDRLAPGDHYLVTAVGIGAVFAAAVFRH
ncbi:3-oxoacyl-ACP synthase [Cellulomonas sp. JZ18]|uniref:3-oxoacyl-[acyl-carrier-protein] synthase III C-terminal domain-containing protein n=1 Tax=Cellulomonas sp. JZ18 TaxID=2654191 RepID=UPI0012D4B80C|nr:3-oxoacyl-[acyl-carrier-protein] synthase III C-terminal domain-containing protein [Cellulomonas sp. JZ18]QGQ18368.1 3-oxoacyl-ACP synthase [Cellulomonas sp. JZ18]